MTNTYVETLIDNFNDNSLNTTVWYFQQGTAHIVEASAQLQITGTTGYPSALTNKFHNLTNDIFAVKWNAGNGTPTSSSQFVIRARDSSANEVLLASNPINSNWGFQGVGAATVSGTLTGTGLGTALTNGTWFGIGMLGSDSILRAYKSTDAGVTWTQFGSCTVGGTFNKTSVQFQIDVGYFNSGESPTWSCNIDEAAVWAAFHKTHVRVGGAWVEASVKARVGGAWVRANPRSRVGGLWVPSH